MADLDAFHLSDVSVDCDSPIVLANRISMMAERGLAEGLVTIASLDGCHSRNEGPQGAWRRVACDGDSYHLNAESKPRVRLDGDE